MLAHALRSRKLHAMRKSAIVEPVLPDKLYFRMREVSKLTRTEPYVLRFWETKFPQLKPTKTRSQHRLFRREDIRTILEIRNLLYTEGFTIAGARKRLSSESKKSAASRILAAGGNDGDFRAVKRELERILTMLSRRC